MYVLNNQVPLQAFRKGEPTMTVTRLTPYFLSQIMRVSCLSKSLQIEGNFAQFSLLMIKYGKIRYRSLLCGEITSWFKFTEKNQSKKITLNCM